MTYINFDQHFMDFMHAWLEEHQDELLDIAQVEQMMPQLYDLFSNSPMPWLDMQTPAAFFGAMNSPEQLLEMMMGYLNADVPLPDLLLMRIVELGPESEHPLMNLLFDAHTGMEARMLCVRLLQDIGSTKPMQAYIAWQLAREDRDELADFALESLEEMGEQAVPMMLEALNEANDIGREALLSVLSRYPGHPEVYTSLIRLFDALPERQAVLAAYLGRLGDVRALPVLMERANEETLKYLDYIELRAAIEALGGEAPERTFDHDPEYEALMGLD
ncbi:MAG: hypothetical protein GXZ04_06200 [Clostridiales bacterium]|nr:hypothetical protein [Clostridiales bacterium]